jgi:hypothetical protein
MTEQEGLDWKWLNEEKLYKVYKDGRVFSYLGNKFLNANYNKARKTYLMHIRIDNKYTIMGVHTIVYTAFIGKISRKLFIDFKDKNSKNYHLDNLIVLKLHDIDNKPRKVHIPSNKIGDIEDVDWKWLNEEQYYKIYKDGRIYSTKIDKFLEVIARKNNDVDEVVITIHINKVRKTIKLCTTIWKLFVGKIERTHGIYFKDGNFKNIHLDNLYKKHQKTPMKIDYDPNAWTPVFGYEEFYLVSKKGDIRSLFTGELMKCDSQVYNEKSYKSVGLANNKNDKNKKFRVHRLVYSSFHKIDLNKHKDKVIDHINRNSLDNRLENLRLVNHKENANNCNNPKKHKIYSIKPLANDFTPIKNYKDYDLSNYLINSFGQIKPVDNKQGNKIHAGCISTSLYKMMSLTENKTKKNVHVLNHILVASTFLPNPNNYDTVHHKDSNRQNNHISNLEWTTRKQNVIYSIGKAINQYTLDGIFLRRFDTIKFAAISLNKKTSADISKVCRGINKSAYGYKWKFAE